MPVDRGARTDSRQRKTAQRLYPWVRVYPAGTPSPIVCPHHHGTLDVFVSCFQEAPPRDGLNPRIQHTDPNNTTLIFGGPLAAETRVVISAQ